MDDSPVPRSPARVTDSIVVELNGQATVRGPAEDRLAEHDAETAAWEARQAEEG
jgi:hypothetical protein